MKQYEGEIPVLNLPIDYPRPPMWKFDGKTVTFEISKEETVQLLQKAEERDNTLFMTLLATTGILLSKISAQENIVIGTPVMGRPHADLQTIIGIFINTLALKTQPTGEKTVNDYLDEVAAGTLEALENQEYPFEDLVENVTGINRDTGRNPLFDVMLSYQEAENEPLEIPGITLKPYEYTNRTAKFDLTFTCKIINETLVISIEYSTNLFKPETIRRIITYFKKLIPAIHRNPGAKIAQLEVMPEEEKRKILYEFNDTAADYPENKTIRQLFEEQVERTPEATAVIARTEKITYGQLNQKANQVAAGLIEKGITPETVVAIVVERTLEMVAGIFGILKAGAAYLPISPAYPEERIAYILRDSNTKMILTQKDAMGKLKHKAEKKKKETIEPQTANSENSRPEILRLEEMLESKEAAKVEPRPRTHTSNIAYIIYTSGSTGKPKGVLIENTSVVNILTALQRKYPFTETDTYLFKTAFIFDVSVSEIFGWILGGGRMALLEKDGEKDPHQILTAIETYGVTHINFVPSMFSVFLAELETEGITSLSKLKYIFLAGEALLPSMVERYLRLRLILKPTGLDGENTPGLTGIENIYGPTEATIYASEYTLTKWDGTGTIPIGEPMQNLELYILDIYGKQQPVGVPGELCISGVGLARGYLNRPELTAEKFVNYKLQAALPNNQSPITGNRLYKTGDLCRWQPDGNIEFMGRIDHQVKIRGFRIELGEIENRLQTHEKVKETVVVAREDTGGDKYICAYIVEKKEAVEEPNNEQDRENRETGETGTEMETGVDTAELRQYLLQELPEYMVPSYIVPIEALPLNPGGKVDRKALPEPRAAGKRNEYIAPRDRMEEKLAELWAGVLTVEKERISITDNFFESGGHSLKATVLISRLHKEMKVKVSLQEFFKRPVIKELAQYIKQEAPQYTHYEIEPAPSKRYYQLSSSQKRMYVLWRMNPESTVYNMPRAMVIKGGIDEKKLQDVLEKLIKRHESLRTRFSEKENVVVQEIKTATEFKIEKFALKEKVKEKEGKILSPEADKIVRQFIRPFDLTEAPLVRIGLIEIDDPTLKVGRTPTHIFMLDMHHIIGDGYSMDIIIRDFNTLFGGKELAPLTIQYKDYAEWQNKDEQKKRLEEMEQFWLTELAGDLPELELPTDYPRPEKKTFAGNTVSFSLEKEATEAVNEIAAGSGATIFMVLLAAYTILLSKLSGQDEIVVGTPVAGRTHADMENIVGVFINTLPNRNYPTAGKTFRAFLQEVKVRFLSTLENQDYPLDDLLEKLSLKRNMSRNPIFDVGFMLMENVETGREMQGLEMETHAFESKVARLDIGFDAIVGGPEINFRLEYCTGLFEKESIELFGERYLALLRSIVKNSDETLEKLDYRSEAEKTPEQAGEDISGGTEFNVLVKDGPKRKKIIEDYWMRRLAGEIPQISLPILDIAAEDDDVETEQHRVEIPGSISQGLLEICEHKDMAVYLFFLCALDIALYKYTGIKDILVGTVTPKKEKVKDKLVLFREKITPEFTFEECINQVKTGLIEDLKYSDYSFGMLYQKLLFTKGASSLDIFNAAFIYDKIHKKGRFLNQFSLVFTLTNKENRLALEVDYNSNRYTAEIVNRFCRNLISLFDNIPEKIGRQ
ncbi:MAG: amino acid adenylation domain-containing protein, partial [bacterium]|nr:amino acid adenylation domain-containing protein [bacterium]